MGQHATATRPYDPDWIVEHITPNGHKSTFYPLWIEGHHLDTGEAFYWNVPDVESWRHVLTPQAQEELASIVERARPARVPFWHPALPEVLHAQGDDFAGIWFHAVAASRPTIRTTTGGGWMWRGALAALLLSFAAPAFAAPAPCVVNVTTCSVVTCAYLPGVGQVTGGLISNAHPKNESELDSIKGIGPKKLETMRPFVVYGDTPTTCTAKQTAPKSEKE